ncbi:MAG: (deoxy)nucleoside triphosphate pyrophosphohydrolase [Myxococcales bacterium]|nr:(deoxy)nucleoside triphosphate pyrophosphohydrolase [Myxococcales bacterium]
MGNDSENNSDGSRKRIRVVAATIERDGKFLITQRRAEAVLPLLWEFPGGRVEAGESDAGALQRELDERLGARIEVGDELATIFHDYERYSVTLVIYQATLLAGELEPRRVNEYRWVPSSEFGNYEFPPADQSTMDKLLGEAGGNAGAAAD